MILPRKGTKNGYPEVVPFLMPGRPSPPSDDMLGRPFPLRTENLPDAFNLNGIIYAINLEVIVPISLDYLSEGLEA